MIFRPKIFISSTFTENIKLREDIRKYFYSAGAEPLLYENELTPSVLPMTYRNNLLDADFVILIIKEDYGTETEFGISGIHEEYKIAFNNNIPLHVYLQKNNTEDNPLVKELKRDGISYYYFNSDTELLKRLKETTFTIAKEIMYNRIDKSELPDTAIKKQAGNIDYVRSMQVVSIIEAMCIIVKSYDIDWIYSNIFTECMSRVIYEFSFSVHNFINWKLDELLVDILSVANSFIEHSVRDFTSTGTYNMVEISILGKTRVNHLQYQKCSDWDKEDYKKALKEFFEKYDEFKKLVQNIRTEIDLIQ